ncbi:MAG TPA: SAM-dependent methyltransferase [Permianibacter sp.]|nr:SAM-dependent methyltransferase [Permianibacter sp.]
MTSGRRTRAGNGRKQGELIVVGTGIMAAAHCSQEAINAIRDADVVFAAVPDPLGLNWLQQQTDRLQLLDDLYHSCPNRLATYHAMTQRIMTAVRAGKNVCAVFYGHPGVFVLPSHLAIEQAQAEGYPAQMLPGISAADCLFADLGVDPSHPGCQMYEASAFLFWRYQISVHAALILWQIGVVGDHTLTLRRPSNNGLQVLCDQLLQHYPKRHPVCIYEATRSPLQAPRRDWLALAELPHADVNGYSTLYVPPHQLAPVNVPVLKQLGLRRRDLAELE